MRFIETKLQGAFVVELEKNEDERGFFSRSFCRREFQEHGLNPFIAQGGVTRNAKRGTLRGMHFQTHPFQEEKSVRCVRGAVYDVIVDLRKNSGTYKQWFGVELTEDNSKMLYIPKDFAHGYLTLRDDTELHYFMGQFYEQGSERGVRYNDPAFQIRWPENVEIETINDRDKQWPDY